MAAAGDEAGGSSTNRIGTVAFPGTVTAARTRATHAWSAGSPTESATITGFAPPSSATTTPSSPGSRPSASA